MPAAIGRFQVSFGIVKQLHVFLPSYFLLFLSRASARRMPEPSVHTELHRRRLATSPP